MVIPTTKSLVSPLYLCDILSCLDEPRQLEVGFEQVLEYSQEVEVGQGLLHQLVLEE